MKKLIKGLHHVTGIAGSANKNLDFYTRILGFRLIKKTVNIDDPSTYHFYYGNESGDPGTIFSFFTWGKIFCGKHGINKSIIVGFSVPSNSFRFWIKRFEKEGVIHDKPTKRFNEKYIAFTDPDGLNLELVARDDDHREPFLTKGIIKEYGIRGIYNVSLVCRDYSITAEILATILGYKKIGKQGNRHRYSNEIYPTASIIDLVSIPMEEIDPVACGSIHHIAFRVANEDTQLEIREQLMELGFNPSPVIDMDYFKSIYFKVPGNFFFEIATDSPGFTRDESHQNLGSTLKLPAQYENNRDYLEKVLPVLS